MIPLTAVVTEAKTARELQRLRSKQQHIPGLTSSRLLADLCSSTQTPSTTRAQTTGSVTNTKGRRERKPQPFWLLAVGQNKSQEYLTRAKSFPT